MTRHFGPSLLLLVVVMTTGCNDASNAGETADAALIDAAGDTSAIDGSGTVEDASATDPSAGDAADDPSVSDGRVGEDGDDTAAVDEVVTIDVAPDGPPVDDDAPADAEETDSGEADIAADAPEGSGEAPRWLGGDPTGDGPYTFATFDDSLDVGDREVALRIYIPTAPVDAPYPVVVFNHGFQMAGDMYTTYAERLASHGFVAILPTIGDSLFSSATHTELADIQIAIDAWIETGAETPGQRLFGVADPTLIGAGGHSRGGKASIHAATRDPRIRASLTVDPVDSGPPFGGNPTDFPSVTPELMGSLAIPTGFVGSSEGASGIVACAPGADNYHQYFLAAPVPTYEYLVQSSGHNDFIDTCNVTCQFACPRGDEPERALEFARTVTVAFYKVFLASDASYAPWVSGAALPSYVAFGARL